MKINHLLNKALVAAGLLAAAASAQASLTPFKTFTGNVGYSSDGFGSASQSGVISALVPAGSTVIAAFLYTSTYGSANFATVGGTLDGISVSYTKLGSNSDLQAGRMDVTNLVKAKIDQGPGGVYNFNLTETNAQQDGEALVVVYSNPSLSVGTFALLDGFSSSSGDATTVNFATPLDPTAPGFIAEMFIGDGFSYGSNTNTGQSSTIEVNGVTITRNAGGYDDGQAANGALISVGGFNDPYSPFLPKYEDDHERYNLTPFLKAGDASINVRTTNPSGDDNIFLAGIYASGVAAINAPAPAASPVSPSVVPEPATISLAGLGLLGLGFTRLRRKA